MYWWFNKEGRGREKEVEREGGERERRGKQREREGGNGREMYRFSKKWIEVSWRKKVYIILCCVYMFVIRRWLC